MNQEKVGRFIRELRIEKEMTQQELANKLNVTEKEKNEGSRLIWETPERALELVKNCYETLVESNYGSIYATKFVVLRDRKILEYYIENYF